MASPPIYLDHHSTTPCDPRVVEKMLPYFTATFGNPAAITHVHGRKASTAIEEARIVVGSFLRCRPTEIFFTAGATESNNTILSALPAGSHVITTAIEHKSVLVPLARAERRGVTVTRLTPDREGFVRADQVSEAIVDTTALVSVMWANGEIGTVEPIREIAAICRDRGILFHSDATQAVGKIEVDLSESLCDFISFSAHKFYGPKGVGGLFIREGKRVEPLFAGGGQEKGIRSGTVNVPGVVGMAEALELRRAEMAEEATRLTGLRNHLWDALTKSVSDVRVNGPRQSRLPGNLSVSFEGVDADSLMLAMRRFSLSSGSACSSGDREPSYVLRAIGLDMEAAVSTIRFGLGKQNVSQDVELLLNDLVSTVPRLRELVVS